MKILLSPLSKKKLFNTLKKRNNCNLHKLAVLNNIKKGTINDWAYNKERYLPEIFIPKDLLNELEIIDKQKDNWGKIKAGKNTYKKIIAKYGIKEIRRRQSNGGKNSSRRFYRKINIDINDPLFLELYGILLGDGWLSKFNYKNKVIRFIGICGHKKLDRDFIFYCRRIIQKLFDQKGYIRDKSKYNSIELTFGNLHFFNFLTKELGFPIGKKINLRINKRIKNLGFKKLRYTIRGIFDTDGCFYLDKTPVGRPYPCISIHMHSPILINQIGEILLKQGFKVLYSKKGLEIKLKGRKQLNKWMGEIGSSNLKHLDKINALVAQQDRVPHS